MFILVGKRHRACCSTVSSASNRAVAHAIGTTYVPERIQRVVTVDTAALDAAVALGARPVGTVVYRDLPGCLGDRVRSVESVGDRTQPNLEAVARLNPTHSG